jgi:hypothetical protein
MKETRELVPVRLSHLLHHCSIGAIVRGPDYLMTTKDIRQWTDKSGEPAGRKIPYVDGVRAALGISQELREPPVATELENGFIDGACIPTMRFPLWMRCPNPECGLLYYKPWRNQTQGPPRCKHCEKNAVLEQVQWILAHPDGHMNDVPWHFLTHIAGRTSEQKQCKGDWREPYLRLIVDGTSHQRLRCDRCGTTSDFDSSVQIPYGNTRRQPWIKDSPEIAVGSDADKAEHAFVLEINDARVHSSTTCNALVIPPESRIRKGAVVDRLYQSSQKLHQIDQARTSLVRAGTLKTLATEFRCTIHEIEDAWNEIQKGYPLYGKNMTPGILFENEYQALLETIPDIFEDEDFVTRHLTPAWKALSANLPPGGRSGKIVDIVSNLISVERLKEIQVLKGFQRLGGNLTPPDIVGQSAWLPAIELYGEGIFFTLEEGLIASWEKIPSLLERAGEFERRYINANLQYDADLHVSPRFLLLHTLAHLLIRQLETGAGYPAASLKERIYCTSGGASMAGILVYVAVPDVVGSLGGLAELAEPRRFLLLLASVFDHAEWCSLDPVCSEHDGQGPNLLNRAACHACALAPETSCAYGNVLLDRTFIKGDSASEIPAFLDYVQTGA